MTRLGLRLQRVCCGISPAEVWQGRGAFSENARSAEDSGPYLGKSHERRGDFSIQRRRAEREIDASRFSFGPASYFNKFTYLVKMVYLCSIVNIVNTFVRLFLSFRRYILAIPQK